MSESTAAAQTWTPPPVGSPCWVEIPAVDVQACKQFYAQLFPSWSFMPVTEEHPAEKIATWKFKSPTDLSGGIVQVPAECKVNEQKQGVGVTIYYFVDSIEDTQKRVEELGGTTEGEKTPERDSGWYMNFKDVAGNRFAAYQLRLPS